MSENVSDNDSNKAEENPNESVGEAASERAHEEMNAPANQPATVQSSEGFFSSRLRGLPVMGASLKNAARALCFRQIREIEPNWLQLIQLATLTVLLRGIADYLLIGTDAEFNLNGLPDAVFFVPALIVLSRFVVRVIGRREAMFSLLIVYAAMWVPISILCYLCEHVYDFPALRESLGFLSFYGVLFFRLWFVLAALTLAWRMCASDWRRRAGLVLLGIMLMASSPYTVYFSDGALWHRPFKPEEWAATDAKRHPFDRENVIYQQGKLLDQTLAAIRPGRPDRINLFFVGLAGYAEQDVFMKEIHSVDALFRERFGTTGHSAVLINNPATVSQTPIANTTSLQMVLNQTGAVMDRERDILFLYLTSHGSRDFRFSLKFGSMQFNELDPVKLRKMLDESGIKRRVVVIAACYSGGFVDALKDDNTLVVTAAAADKTSFGCSNEEDFTYFGRAYFNEALRKTDSFIDAFALAKPVIAAREKEVKEEPSNPQIYVGNAIKAALVQWQLQRKQYREETVANRGEGIKTKVNANTEGL